MFLGAGDVGKVGGIAGINIQSIPSFHLHAIAPHESIGYLDTQHTLYIYNQRIRRLSDLMHGEFRLFNSFFFFS